VVTRDAYTLFLLALAVERGFELWLSRRNAAWARRAGAVEYGARHLRWMKVLHGCLFIGCLTEVWLLERPFIPVLGLTSLALTLAAQGLRYWTIATLGRRWNIAVLVLPGVPAVTTGPYRFLRHPNYLAVVAEGLAIPLLHSAFVTAGVFSLLNALLLCVRIDCEERALALHCGYAERFAERPRLWPARSNPP
jgi:methyltransferase